jgi:ribonuclease HI
MQHLTKILDFNISLFWCPAHIEVKENKEVDALAKEATEGTHLQLRNVNWTLASIQHITPNKFIFNKKKKPIQCNDIQLTTLPSKIFDSLKNI